MVFTAIKKKQQFFKQVADPGRFDIPSRLQRFFLIKIQ